LVDIDADELALKGCLDGVAGKFLKNPGVCKE